MDNTTVARVLFRRPRGGAGCRGGGAVATALAAGGTLRCGPKSECCGESNAYLLRLPDAFISAPGARDPLRRCWVRPKTSKEPVRRAGLGPASSDALKSRRTPPDGGIRRVPGQPAASPAPAGA